MEQLSFNFTEKQEENTKDWYCRFHTPDGFFSERIHPVKPPSLIYHKMSIYFLSGKIRDTITSTEWKEIYLRFCGASERLQEYVTAATASWFADKPGVAATNNVATNNVATNNVEFTLKNGDHEWDVKGWIKSVDFSNFDDENNASYSILVLPVKVEHHLIEHGYAPLLD